MVANDTLYTQRIVPIPIAIREAHLPVDGSRYKDPQPNISQSQRNSTEGGSRIAGATGVKDTMRTQLTELTKKAT